MDTLVCYGGAVKALGEGKVGGYLVMFGSAAEPDTSHYRDYFTPETDFGISEWPAKSAVYYHHGLDPEMKKRRLAIGAMKTDDVGVWIEAQLALRDEWEQAVYSLAEAKKLGWSSGTAAHLIDRTAIKSEAGQTVAHEIKYWPLGLDASLTPAPAEPRCEAQALKSLLGPPLLTLAQAEPALKGMFGDYISQDMTMAAVRVLNDRLMYGAVGECLYDYRDEDKPIGERLTQLKGAFDEFRDRAVAVVEAILASAPGAEDSDTAMKAVRTLWGPAVPEDLSSHTSQVVTACEGYASRLEGRLEARIKAGRTLSAANQKELEEVHSALMGLDEIRGRLRAVLDKACPPAEDETEAKSLTLRAEKLRQQIRGTLALYGHP